MGNATGGGLIVTVCTRRKCTLQTTHTCETNGAYNCIEQLLSKSLLGDYFDLNA